MKYQPSTIKLTEHKVEKVVGKMNSSASLRTSSKLEGECYSQLEGVHLRHHIVVTIATQPSREVKLKWIYILVCQMAHHLQ